MHNNLYTNDINETRPGAGIYIQSLSEMYQQLVYTYQPMQIGMLLNAIRQHGNPHWKQIDMKSEYSFDTIIDHLMTNWHLDVATISQECKQDKPETVNILEKNPAKFRAYFEYLIGTQGKSVVTDIFGIEMIHDLKCLQCSTMERKLQIVWQYIIPINIHCLRYWTIESDNSTNGTFMFITPEQLIYKPNISDVFELIVKDIEGDDDINVELQDKHYIKVNGIIKYAVFVSYLTQGKHCCAWTSQHWHMKLKKTLDYNTQCKYTLVFQEIDEKIDISKPFAFHVEQYHVVGTNTYFPKSYPYIEWIGNNNNNKNNKHGQQIQTYEIKKIETIHKENINPPTGDSNLALHEQLEFTMTKGYLKYCHCNKCNKQQPMRVKPQIYKINHIALIHLLQSPTQYYQFTWNPDTAIHGLPIKEDETVNVSINAYISANRINNVIKYATHFKSQQWHTMSNEKFVQHEEATEMEHTCILLATKMNLK